MSGTENLAMEQGTPREENEYAELKLPQKHEPKFKDSNMMDKITKLDAAFNVIMNKGSNMMDSFPDEIIGSNMKDRFPGEIIGSKTKHRFTDEVIAYYSSDSQKIMEFLGKVVDEVHKMKKAFNPLCSKGWRHYGLSCYYVSSESKSWSVSKKDCEDKNAHLVVINGKGEMNFLRGIVTDFSLWIGLTDMGGTWKWVDGSPFDVTPEFWGDQQPDDWKDPAFQGREDCVVLRRGVEWNDVHCSNMFPYICEKEIVF
ncbi:C-type lectin domain family 10 member A-like isoform X4 [Lithobates pipiens]